jgi:hypothetical protein
MAQYFDRYSGFRGNNEIKPVPGIKIPEASTDKNVIYKDGVSRLDKISNTYYNNPYSGWLILLANPQFGGLENNIFDGAVLIIPYPLLPSLQDYKASLENYFYYYGR